MIKENFKAFIGHTIKHNHSSRLAVLLAVEDGCNGGLRIEWLVGGYEISLPCSDFTIIEEQPTC